MIETEEETDEIHKQKKIDSIHKETEENID
jgi:hypothetical protein